MTRLLAIAASALFVVADATVFSVAPATAAPASSCSTSKGVLVVVDLRRFGHDIERGCAPSPSTGRNALDSAGFTATDVNNQPGFVCQINGEPANPCPTTPPASGYWSYWHADRGQSSWTYSRQGASSAHPGNGSIDAWVFGATNTSGTSGGPCFTPSDARAGRATGCTATPAAKPPSRSATKHGTPSVSHKPNATTAARASHAGTLGTVQHSGSASATGSATAPHSPARGRPASASNSSAAASPAASTSAPAGSGAPSIIDATPASAAQRNSSGGSVLPVVFGLALAVLLAGGAGWTTLRRRRSDAGG